MSTKSTSPWYIYLLRCADNSLYCGITTHPKRRLRQHNGELVGGAKYTKLRQPCQLVYLETAENRSQASQREYAIKQLSKQQKETLCHHHPVDFLHSKSLPAHQSNSHKQNKME